MAKPKVDKGTGSGMSAEDCLALGEKTLTLFTRDELQDYVTEVKNRAATYQDVTGQAAIKRAMQEVNNEKLAFLFDDCTKKAENIRKFQEHAKLLESGKSNMERLLTPRGKSVGNTVQVAQSTARALLSRVIYNKDWTKEREAHLFNKNNDIATYDALDGKTSTPMAKEMADLLNKYRDMRNAESVRSGALSIEHISQYKYLDHNHDATKMISGGDNLVQTAKNLLNGVKTIIEPKMAWINYIKPKLDLEVMFGSNAKAWLADGKLDMKYVDEVLERVFDNITTGKNELFTKSFVANDREAVKNKMRMRLLFKDWRSWGEYNEKYGRGSLQAALQADMMRSGGKIGMADFFGDNPSSMYLDLNKLQSKIGVKLSKLQTMQSWMTRNDFTFKNLLGASPSSVRPEASNFMASLRGYTSAISAARITLSSLSDTAHMAEYIGRFGKNRFASFGYMLANMFNNKMGELAFPERVEIARQYKLMVDTHIGYMANMMDAQNVGDVMNRVASGAFKFFQTEAMDKGNKISVLHLMADNLGRNSSKSWEQLNKHLRKQLDNHNISEHEWELLRGKTEKNLFTLENVDRLTDAELREYFNKTGGKGSLVSIKNDLYRKVYSMFDVAAENSILNPGAFTKANMFGNSLPGTLQGEFWRIITHFKSYPHNFIDRVWMQGLQNADTKVQKLAFATRLMAMTMPLSFLSTWLGYFVQGKSLPDMDDPKFWIGMALPGLGIFLSILDKKNQNQDLLFSIARSPSMGLVANMLSSALSLATGDPDNAQKRFKKAMRSLLPMDSVPFIAPWLREMLGDKSYLAPGQHQLYGA